jgi:hypothetical protein
MTEQIVYARTHAEFLNKAFGTDYSGWMRSRWEYDEDTWVWMVRFDGRARQGWINCIIDDNEIWEKYIGDEPPTYREDDKRFRIVVSIEKGITGREYCVLGTYMLDQEKSTVGRHVLIKVEE